MKYLHIALISSVLFMNGCRGWNTEKPPIHPNINLDFQASIKAQESPRPVPEYSIQFENDTNDIPLYKFDINEAFIKNGQRNYNIYCAACHTKTGNGTKSIISQNGWVVSNILEQTTINKSNRELYNIVKNGVRSMPGYGSKLSSQDMWEIVIYIRALQKVETATSTDIRRAKQWSNNGRK